MTTFQYTCNGEQVTSDKRHFGLLTLKDEGLVEADLDQAVEPTFRLKVKSL